MGGWNSWVDIPRTLFLFCHLVVCASGVDGTPPFPDHDYEFESIASVMVETPMRDNRETLKTEPVSVTNDKKVLYA